MVRITEELVRKKSEHNELIINSLEELSLHQEDVEKIEHLNNWCKNLEILYLQANLIAKIENLNKLKKLKYLNLAINNIEVVENLERCESLEKLDLTLNFIGDIESVCSLKHNIHLRHLYLTGNPCVDYEGYKTYVIANLPQLENLDNNEVTRSEKIKAMHMLDKVTPKVLAEQEKYRRFREAQRERLKHIDTDMPDELYWKSSSENAPETRVEMARRSKKSKGREVEKKEQKSVRMFTKEGRPLNINQSKLKFRFNDEDPSEYVLDVSVYKYLDTNLIDVDLQPIYVRIMIKKKVFQFVFPEEICTSKSTAQRSQTTGHLVLTMPRIGYKPRVGKTIAKKTDDKRNDDKIESNENKRNMYLEIGTADESMDFSKIVENNKKRRDFLDNPEVPLLEYV